MAVLRTAGPVPGMAAAWRASAAAAAACCATLMIGMLCAGARATVLVLAGAPALRYCSHQPPLATSPRVLIASSARCYGLLVQRL